MGASLEQRFWKKVQRGGEDDCWPWMPNESKYGHIFSSGKMLLAHHVSWELHYGSIPASLCVLHTCDNQKCVNPKHLFLGTRSDNMIDCVRKGRHAAHTKPQTLRLFRSGSLHPRAKLTEEQVAEIRKLKGTMGRRDLAKRFGVHPATINYIQRGKAWTHI